MARPTYTIQNEDRQGWTSIYDVLADNLTGFDDFVRDHGQEACPGSKIDIADYKMIFRLRNDDNWEQWQDYATAEERAEIDDAAIVDILAGLIPEEETA